MSQQTALLSKVVRQVIGEFVLLTAAVIAPLYAQSAQYSLRMRGSDSGGHMEENSSAFAAKEAVIRPADSLSSAPQRTSFRNSFEITPLKLCSKPEMCAALFSTSHPSHRQIMSSSDDTEGDRPSESVKQPPVELVRNSKAVDLDHQFYYRNKLEFSCDVGWLPINIPFVFDVFLGDGYTMTNLKYTLVPVIASLRWQVDDVGGPWIFRGNWDIEASAAVTLIPRGPESRYIAWIMGFRRNFVPRKGKIAPYFDGRVGLGNIDAKEPLGVVYAQGQDFTFTLNMGSGVRYNFNPRYSFSAGLNWMHISNLYLSEPKFANYGINVYGPMFGVNVRLGRLGHHGSE